jgi:outer membrane protein assembly factor BamB
VPLKDGGIVALDRQTGGMDWRNDTNADWPLVVDGGVLYGASSREIFAVDAASGEVKWQASLVRAVLAPVGLQQGLVVAVMDPDTVIAYHASTGQPAWQHSLGATAGAIRVTVGSDGVYLAAPQGRLVALSLADGHQLWALTIPGALTPPASTRDRVFIGSSDNVFYALNSRNGHLEWKWRTGGDVVGATADRDAAYFVSLDNILRAVNRGNGNQRWQKDTGTRPTGAPHVVGPIVVVPGVAATLSAFSVLTGAPVGSFSPPSSAELEFEGDPMFDPVLLPFEVAAAILTRDGRVIALRPTGMMFREAPPAALTQLPGRTLEKERPPVVPPEESSAP